MELRSNESDTTSTELSKDTTDVSKTQLWQIKITIRKKMTQTLPIQAKKRRKINVAYFYIVFLKWFCRSTYPLCFSHDTNDCKLFTKQSKSKAAGVRNAIFYGISIILIYVILGTIVTSIFWL